jgi:hypothetical protein
LIIQLFRADTKGFLKFRNLADRRGKPKEVNWIAPGVFRASSQAAGNRVKNATELTFNTGCGITLEEEKRHG